AWIVPPCNRPSIAARVAAASVRSNVATSALPFASRTPVTTDSARLRFALACTITRQPSRASVAQIAPPMSPLPPVTNTRLASFVITDLPHAPAASPLRARLRSHGHCARPERHIAGCRPSRSSIRRAPAAALPDRRYARPSVPPRAKRQGIRDALRYRHRVRATHHARPSPGPRTRTGSPHAAGHRTAAGCRRAGARRCTRAGGFHPRPPPHPADTLRPRAGSGVAIPPSATCFQPPSPRQRGWGEGTTGTQRPITTEPSPGAARHRGVLGHGLQLSVGEGLQHAAPSTPTA